MNAQNHPPADGVAPEEFGGPTGATDITDPDPQPVARPPAGPIPPSIRRSRTDKVAGGVCGGLGAAAGIDPLWFRLGFIFLALSSGVGVILYIIAWIAIPEATDDVPVAPGRQSNNGAVIFGIFLLAIGSALLADAVVPWFDRIVWPLALIGVGVGMIYFSATRRFGR
ncbi:MAG: PspC domain-containing protein [Acidimicrobiia bacterium]|nr:PspC domain-containing protein [Acidimicrobiia bacterium]